VSVAGKAREADKEPAGSAANGTPVSPPRPAPAPSPLESALRRRLRGEVRFDDVTRVLYSTDASIYRIPPLGVVFPRDEADVVAAVQTAAEFGAPILPRGSGTSLAGQTVGAAVVLDFTPHMRAVLEVDPAERWARVQPGVVLDELNALLRPHGLKFAPDPATSSRASIGGMIGNNSSGARSVQYGKTVDHVLALRVVLADGSVADLEELPPAEWEARASRRGFEGRIYAETQRLCREHAAEVEARFPRIMRRVGGYNLDEFVRHGRRNLAKLVVGSEGTLATVVEARLNLVPVPRCTGMLVSLFDDLLESLRAIPVILPHRPAAVELLDRVVLDLTRNNRELAAARAFIRVADGEGEPEAALFTEVDGDTPEEVAARLEEIAAGLEAAGRGYGHLRLTDAASQKDVWTVRKAGMGVLMGMKGDIKPATFVEDTAVDPNVLADYIRDFRAMLAEYGLDACYYAHASVGCLHIRPILNLKEPEDLRRMREIAARVADLVLRYGGAMSAEHGDGLARSEWQERVFGARLYGVFRELKAAWDPQGIMNPGKIVDAPPMDTHLRFERDYRTIPVETLLDFTADGGFARAVEMCSGAGACRKNSDGAMCPSYRATQEEVHSTRGRANVLRAVISGELGPPDLADPRLREVLDLCLECKACKTECPSNVDMAKLKYEVLSHAHARLGAPPRARFFGHVARSAALASRWPALANWAQELPPVRALLARRFGVDRRRSLPRFAARTFRAWLRGHAPAPGAGRRGEVLLLADTFTNYQEPEIGIAAVRVLEACGWRVRVPETRCCGRPLISKGLLAEARANAAWNVELLAADELPVLGLEPSCVSAYRDEYAEFRLGAAAASLAARTWLLEDFLAAHVAPGEAPFAATERSVLAHGHCHQKALVGTRGMLAALRLAPGYRVAEIPSGCCGMAGSFGYEAEHYDLSLRIGELSLFPAVRAAPPETLLVAPGASCRHQIRDAAGREAVHPAVALAATLS
jgi:FAD/FMN-containing dehydrogenase/Fe-S oxidoreductase